ncbi:hypothetical protein PGT21_030790 [Puccinia graminis f. sp. tritici]|uniref:Uncharacterized protein n=1 Tax=Puccinia graminis f. sp. tritici TaxID=56615 RepID=A0A5B0QC80_PUCGR|nr:hypothetical protein PGT21_014941 [Puccinia graminis f. sp. tritici]KAA1110751.1 hypothetical protein PGT21_030790 [Puccinia graminis f. sp. tritici]
MPNRKPSSTKKTNIGIGFKKIARRSQTIEYKQTNFCVYEVLEKESPNRINEKSKDGTSSESHTNTTMVTIESLEVEHTVLMANPSQYHRLNPMTLVPIKCCPLPQSKEEKTCIKLFNSIQKPARLCDAITHDYRRMMRPALNLYPP